MGLLADIYSAGDGLKRKVGGLLSDPMGTIDLGISRLKEDNNNALNLFSNAFPMAGEKTVLNTPEQIAQLQKQAAEYASQVGIAAATVWHGSPHKFDKFDSSKIGTGEGAQAYGHGLYLAESPDVAGRYAREVTGSKLKDLIGHQKASDRNATSSAIDYFSAMKNGVVARDLDAAGKPVSDQYIARQLDGLAKELSMQDAAFGVNPQLYKVDLPDEHIAKMLDYDNAVPENVRKPLSQAALKEFGSGLTDASGEKLYKEMIFNFKQAGHPNPTQAATDWLTQQGITGIRYLDGGSRGTGAGTSNFVVFPGNEGLLSILERNGQPIGGR
jgi:hypothetical protein